MRSEAHCRRAGRYGFRKITAIFFLSLAALLISGINPAAAVDVRVGVYQNEPVIFKDKDGRVKGIYADLLAYVAQAEGWNLKYIQGSWPECIDRLNNHEIDMLVGIAYSKERALLYDFNRTTVIENWGHIYL